jgi:hypothetical protein
LREVKLRHPHPGIARNRFGFRHFVES